VGWLADRRIPTAFRAPAYRAYARATGADLEEVRPPLSGYPSLGAFFVRRLIEGARPLPEDPDLLPSPVDGTLQAVDTIRDGTLFQAKGRPYALRELLAGVGEDVDLEGGQSWTIYLSPRDYHRIHAPMRSRLVEVCWAPGTRYSVAPRVLERRPRVLSINERAVLRLESAQGPYFLILVGALNVGRIRILGVEPGSTPASPLTFERGGELARFEMGSTVIGLWPAHTVEALQGQGPGTDVRMGQPVGRRIPLS